jgi:ElaB/YqjD/DUF883 family membrane-anchored ribosome-binding protein
MAATETKSDRLDAHEEIHQLRAQVEALMRERVAPALTEAAGRVEDAARRVGGLAQDQTDALAHKVQERPLTSLLIAAAVGYLVGRVTR